MANLDVFKVNLDTPQPNGRLGESPRAAFTKYNDALSALSGMVDTVAASAPASPLPYMVWVDTSINPAMIKRRNAANDAWITIGPAFQDLGELGNQVQTNTDDIAANDILIANAIQEIADLEAAALLKAGNLSGLADPAQSRLNLGVVQSLAGVVFNTDNCTVTNNANGTSYRFPNGLQICAKKLTGQTLATTLADGSLFRTAAGINWTYPQPFIERAFSLCEVDSFAVSEARIWFPTVSTGSVSVNQRAVCPLSATHSDVALGLFAIGFWR